MELMVNQLLNEPKYIREWVTEWNKSASGLMTFRYGSCNRFLGKNIFHSFLIHSSNNPHSRVVTVQDGSGKGCLRSIDCCGFTLCFIQRTLYIFYRYYITLSHLELSQHIP